MDDRPARYLFVFLNRTAAVRGWPLGLSDPKKVTICAQSDIGTSSVTMFEGPVRLWVARRVKHDLSIGPAFATDEHQGQKHVEEGMEKKPKSQ